MCMWYSVRKRVRGEERRVGSGRGGGPIYKNCFDLWRSHLFIKWPHTSPKCCIVKYCWHKFGENIRAGKKTKEVELHNASRPLRAGVPTSKYLQLGHTMEWYIWNDWLSRPGFTSTTSSKGRPGSWFLKNPVELAWRTETTIFGDRLPKRTECIKRKQ